MVPRVPLYFTKSGNEVHFRDRSGISVNAFNVPASKGQVMYMRPRRLGLSRLVLRLRARYLAVGQLLGDLSTDIAIG